MSGNPNARPPKRRKSTALSRKIRGGNKKRSSYDLVAARESLGLPPKANAQQISCAVAPSVTNTVDNPSPLKKEVKARLAEQVNKNLLLTKEVSEAQKSVTHKTNQIQTLKQKVRDLSDALQIERKKSRDTIAKLLSDAERIMSDACEIESEADRKIHAAELKVCMERDRSKSFKEAVEEKVSMEKEKSKHNKQEEGRRSAARLVSG